ncbi:MAG: hypothetical protein H6943_07370 [Zoogloeaceae bacterium]|nr:hypothetical protein [Zoogloeaceae bacterium]
MPVSISPPNRTPSDIPGRCSDLFATVVFLMTEYVERRQPMLAAMIAGELGALEKKVLDDTHLRSVLHGLRYRWWQMSQSGEIVEELRSEEGV